jgi:hypothetical protein
LSAAIHFETSRQILSISPISARVFVSSVACTVVQPPPSVLVRNSVVAIPQLRAAVNVSVNGVPTSILWISPTTLIFVIVQTRAFRIVGGQVVDATHFLNLKDLISAQSAITQLSQLSFADRAPLDRYFLSSYAMGVLCRTPSCNA